MIKRQYVSNRGEAYDIEDMESSHILNVITLHKKQLETLNWIIDQYDSESMESILKQVSQIEETILELIEELASR